jgi:predicted kinase
MDNTNVTAAERRRYIDAAKAAGYRVTGYFFETALKAAIARNVRRAGKTIPIPALVRAFKRLEPPQTDEGFDELYLVTLSAGNEFAVSAYPMPGPGRP